MTASTQVVSFDGAFLQRGFWLYVWQVVTPDNSEVLYVGRTGDSSSPNAQSPFNRMGQHLGFAKNSSMLRTHLRGHGVDPQQCRYRMIAHGPVLPEAEPKHMDGHRALRDRVAALERQLQQDLSGVGYTVLNRVASNATLDSELYAPVRAAFAEKLPRLGT